MNGTLTFDSACVDGKDVHRCRYMFKNLMIETTADSRQQAGSFLASILRGMHHDHPSHKDGWHVSTLANSERMTVAT